LSRSAAIRQLEMLQDVRTAEMRKLHRSVIGLGQLPVWADHVGPTCCCRRALLELAHGDGRFPRLFRSITKAQLLVVDDWGPDRLTAAQSRSDGDR